MNVIIQPITDKDKYIMLLNIPNYNEDLPKAKTIIRRRLLGLSYDNNEYLMLAQDFGTLWYNLNKYVEMSIQAEELKEDLKRAEDISYDAKKKLNKNQTASQTKIDKLKVELKNEEEKYKKIVEDANFDINHPKEIEAELRILGWRMNDLGI